MSARTILAAMVLYFLFVGVTANSEPDEPAAVDEKPFPRLVAVPIVCVPAAAFPNLPTEVARHLDENTLFIPQVENGRRDQPDNVISGDFFGTGNKDWAVLAADDDTCFVLVFPDGRADDMQRLWEARLDDYLQGHGDDTFIFSRVISAANPDQICSYAKYFDQPVPIEITHDGIDDYFLGKGSTVWYYKDSEWVELPGAD